MAEPEERQGSGVQDLISRIRDEGVRSGEEEADRLLGDAKRQAEQMLADARAEVEEMHTKARAQIETESTSAIEALKLAARDTALELEAEVVASFENCVRRLAEPGARNPETTRALLLVLAGHAVDEFVKDEELRVFVSDVLFKDVGESPEVDERAKLAVLGLTTEMLREGVEIVPTSRVEGGARVRLVDQNLEIDLTEETVHKVLMKHLLPRFRALLEGAE